MIILEIFQVLSKILIFNPVQAKTINLLRNINLSLTKEAIVYWDQTVLHLQSL